MFISEKELKGIHEDIRELNWRLTELHGKVENLESAVVCLAGIPLIKVQSSIRTASGTISSVSDLNEKIDRLAADLGVQLIKRPAMPATYVTVPEATSNVNRG